MSQEDPRGQPPPSVLPQVIAENRDEIAALLVEVVKRGQSPGETVVWVADLTNAAFWKYTLESKGEEWTAKAAANILSEAMRDKKRPVWLHSLDRAASQQMMGQAPEISRILSAPPEQSGFWVLALLGNTIEAKPMVYETVVSGGLARDARTGDLTFTCEHCGKLVRSGVQVGSDNIHNARLQIQTQCPHYHNMPAPRVDHFDVVQGVLKRIGEANPTQQEVQSLVEILESPAARSGPNEIALAIAAAIPRIAATINDAFADLSDDWPTKLPLLSTALAAFVTQMSPDSAAAANNAAAAFNLMVAILAPKK